MGIEEDYKRNLTISKEVEGIIPQFFKLKNQIECTHNHFSPNFSYAMEKWILRNSSI